ncbi:MAG: N-acetyltransferase [Chloroflexota bacterium]|nr:N-acetyltransferase [Chloroflexota bacterium]
MKIRDETPADFTAIRAVVNAAFPGPAEARLVDRLRADGDAVYSLVAVEDVAVVGHVMFSRMTAPVRALGLGPLAVAPGRQRTGIGRRLVHSGLARARDDGWEAVFVLGDPAYYQRFGFTATFAAGFTSPYAGPHLMGLALGDDPLATTTGRIAYALAFSAV